MSWSLLPDSDLFSDASDQSSSEMLQSSKNKKKPYYILIYKEEEKKPLIHCDLFARHFIDRYQNIWDAPRIGTRPACFPYIIQFLGNFKYTIQS